MPAYPHRTQNRMAYAEAESGFINISKWEPPFAPVDNGHGFIGVIAEDDETGSLQCHICGKWFPQLSTHIVGGHKMKNCDEYRTKFGLFQGTALKSKKLRLFQSGVIRKLQRAGKMAIGNNLGSSPFKRGEANKYAANRKGWKKPVEGANRYGRCDLQIMSKIMDLSKELGGKTPSLVEIKEKYGGGMIAVMHLRYGSYVKYCREYLKMEPLRSQANPWTKEQWKTHLIKVGREGLNKGNPIKVKELLPKNEQRYIYKYFKSFNSYVEQLFSNK